jgi:hypothetical protein
VDAAEAIVKSPSRDLVARWWLWARPIPADRNPVGDPTGAFAGLNQPRDVWFLAGTSGGRAERQCTIPSDRPLFFPVFSTQRAVGLFGGHPLRTIPDKAGATLDGTPLEMHEFTSGRFKLAGRTRVSWGLWCVLEPLSPGAHVLAFEARLSDGFRVDVTYQLVVI